MLGFFSSRPNWDPTPSPADTLAGEGFEDWKLINEKIKIQNFVLFLNKFALVDRAFKKLSIFLWIWTLFGFESTCFIDCESMGFVFKSSFIPAVRKPSRAVPYRTNIVMLINFLNTSWDCAIHMHRMHAKKTTVCMFCLFRMLTTIKTFACIT